ncbi:MAG: serine protease, partial [Gammaproteobacteria bacterium]|nr:serine protease [Gammaproteobacteria bacterium]
STCTRAYKKYHGLYDILLLAASVDMNDRALIIKAGMFGLSKNNGIKIIGKFMESIKWKG